jgi:hypothetical protein
MALVVGHGRNSPFFIRHAGRASAYRRVEQKVRQQSAPRRWPLCLRLRHFRGWGRQSPLWRRILMVQR